ncbi:uncharacterized protein LOC143296946 [Babylonia areolata]|uniref:uncharacterized protein LOC143296946 n=1 Tax=Babylonia areolata TaxID=304850 RepID=UPI003FD623FF
MATTQGVPTTPLTPLFTPQGANNTTTGRPPSFPFAVLNAAFLSVKIGSSIEAILIIVFNTALFVVIVSSVSLRKQMRYQLVLSLVVNNLIVGILSAPFTVDYIVRKAWVHDCYFSIIRHLLTIFVQDFVSMWGLVLILLHYLARLLRYEGPAWLVRLPSWLLKTLPALIVASPWMVAAVLQTSLMFLGMHPQALAALGQGRCPLVMQTWSYYFFSFTCFFFPAVILLTLVVLIVVRGKDSSSPGSGGGGEMGTCLVGKREMEGRTGHVVAAVCALLTTGPPVLFYGLRLYVQASAAVVIIGGVVMMLVNELLPVVLVAVWVLMFPEVQERAWELAGRLLPCCAARFRRHGPPPGTSPSSSAAASVTSVSFRNLTDE